MAKTYQIILSILVILTGAAFWFLVNGAAISVWGFLPAFAAIDLIIFLALAGLSFIFLFPSRVALLLLISSVPILFFLENKLLALAIILLFSLLSFFPASWTRKEGQSRLRFSVTEVLGQGFGTFLTLLALTLAAFLYPQGKIVQFQDIIPESVFENTLEFSGRHLPLPFLSSDLSREEKKNFYQFSIEMLEERFGGYRRYLPAVFALAVFAALRTAFILFGFLAIAFGWLIIKILLYADVLAIKTREVVQDYIEFK